MPNPQSLRDLAIKVAYQVAPELKARSGQTTGIRTKSSDTDLVSEVDHWSEEQVVTLLNEARPNDEIISEEGMRVSGTSGVRWLVDPIDGTTNFIYGHPGFSISIGAEVDAEPTAGVVVDPLLNEVFAAARGAGATRPPSASRPRQRASGRPPAAPAGAPRSTRSGRARRRAPASAPRPR